MPQNHDILMTSLSAWLAELVSRENLPLQGRGGVYTAYSGGVDSHVLLHALASLQSQYRVKLVAIHVNHGLQAQAKAWEAHCAKVCEQLNVPLHLEQVNVQPSGKGVEHAAREARYAVFEKYLCQSSVLVLGHHQADLAETVLFNLCRGSGLAGLSGMPASRPLGKGQLHRPLLGISKSIIQDYAHAHDLDFISDPSNLETEFDRNFIRHNILAPLEQRWPGASTRIARAAMHLKQADEVLTEYAPKVPDSLSDWPGVKGQLVLEALISHPAFWQVNMLRQWCKKSIAYILSTQQCDTILTEVIVAKSDARACLRLGAHELRCFDGCLYLIEPLPEPFEAKQILNFDLKGQVSLPYFGGYQLTGATETTLKKLTIHFRQGGELFKPHHSNHTRPLKKYFQDWKIPYWLRSRYPLIYDDEQLVMVGSVGAAGYEAFVFDVVGIVREDEDG